MQAVMLIAEFKMRFKAIVRTGKGESQQNQTQDLIGMDQPGTIVVAGQQQLFGRDRDPHPNPQIQNSQVQNGQMVEPVRKEKEQKHRQKGGQPIAGTKYSILELQVGDKNEHS